MHRQPVSVHVQLHHSVEDFRRIAKGIYRRDPVASTVELTVLRTDLRDTDPKPLLLTVRSGEIAVGAALQTPPYPLLCGGLPEATVDAVVGVLRRARPDLPGVRGPRGISTAFATAWSSATGAHTSIGMHERLYRLGTLSPPRDVAGGSRSATAGDLNLLIEWLGCFGSEVFGDTPDPAVTARSVHAATALGDHFLLWTVNGEPVSLAAARSPIAGVSRIGPVYTPLNRRGHGYGSAVTAAAAQWARENCASEVVLFADLANPTSNAIYIRIGFDSVGDSVRIDFSLSKTPGMNHNS